MVERITQKFIAKKAGVSSQTISNVINNKDKEINPKTKEKILKIIENYNYTPNRTAKSLRRGSNNLIGLVVPDLVNYPVYSKVFDLIEEWVRNHDFGLLLFNTREDIKKENEAIRNLINYGVSGAIIIHTINDNPMLKEMIRLINFPVIGALRKLYVPKVPSVLTDNKELGLMATNYLIKKGHKKIIHISGKVELSANRKRMDGYLEALKRNNIKINQDYIIYIDYQKKDFYEQLKILLSDIKDFTAIFAYTDAVAINCIKILSEFNYKLPQDVSIIGVDNFNIGNYTNPTLTSIQQPIRKICFKSLELLINAIKNMEKTIKSKNNIFFNPEIIERESVWNV